MAPDGTGMTDWGRPPEQGSAIVLQEEHDGKGPGEIFLVLAHFLAVCG